MHSLVNKSSTFLIRIELHTLIKNMKMHTNLDSNNRPIPSFVIAQGTCQKIAFYLMQLIKFIAI